MISIYDQAGRAMKQLGFRADEWSGKIVQLKGLDQLEMGMYTLEVRIAGTKKCNKIDEILISLFPNPIKSIALHPHIRKYASVAELVDALDSKSSAFGRAGSIPARGTKSECESIRSFFIK